MDLEIAPDFLPGNFSFQELTVDPDQVTRLRPIFTQKFNSEYAIRPPAMLERTGAGLCPRVEHRVRQPTSALTGARNQPGPVASPRAGRMGGHNRVIGAIRKKCGKHTMLHVKHRHVLMDRQLKPICRFLPQQQKHFLEIQIVGDGQLIEAGSAKKSAVNGLATFSEKSPVVETSSDGRKKSSRDSESGPRRVALFQSIGRTPARQISEFAESPEMPEHDCLYVQLLPDKAGHPQSRRRPS